MRREGAPQQPEYAFTQTGTGAAIRKERKLPPPLPMDARVAKTTPPPLPADARWSSLQNQGRPTQEGERLQNRVEAFAKRIEENKVERVRRQEPDKVIAQKTDRNILLASIEKIQTQLAEEQTTLVEVFKKTKHPTEAFIANQPPKPLTFLEKLSPKKRAAFDAQQKKYNEAALRFNTAQKETSRMEEARHALAAELKKRPMVELKAAESALEEETRQTKKAAEVAKKEQEEKAERLKNAARAAKRIDKKFETQPFRELAAKANREAVQSAKQEAESAMRTYEALLEKSAAANGKLKRLKQIIEELGSIEDRLNDIVKRNADIAPNRKQPEAKKPTSLPFFERFSAKKKKEFNEEQQRFADASYAKQMQIEAQLKRKQEQEALFTALAERPLVDLQETHDSLGKALEASVGAHGAAKKEVEAAKNREANAGSNGALRVAKNKEREAWRRYSEIADKYRILENAIQKAEHANE